MIEYCYQPATHNQLLELIKWAQNTLCLRDWTIALDTGPKIPRRLMPGKDDDYEGLAHVNRDRLFAEIWIPVTRLKADNCNPFSACCHEMLHIFVESYLKTDEDELAVEILDPILYVAYCKAFSKKQAKVKDVC